MRVGHLGRFDYIRLSDPVGKPVRNILRYRSSEQDRLLPDYSNLVVDVLVIILLYLKGGRRKIEHAYGNTVDKNLTTSWLVKVLQKRDA